MEEKTFTQEELNSIVSERLNKEKDKYASQISELENKMKGYESQIANFSSQIEELNKTATNHKAELDERDRKLKEYETQSVKVRVATKFGLPYELAGRLSGDTEEEITKDAESLKGLLNVKGSQPSFNSEGSHEAEDSVTAALRKLANQTVR